jgi:hypothetical protein
LELGLDDGVQAVEALAHIDVLGVEVDSRWREPPAVVSPPAPADSIALRNSLYALWCGVRLPSSR